MRGLLVVIVLLASCTPKKRERAQSEGLTRASAAACSRVPVQNFADLSRFLSEERIRDAASLLARLPASLGSNTVFLRSSESTLARWVDGSNPRILLMGSEGRLVVALNLARPEELEVIEFDVSTRSWVFRHVRLGEGVVVEDSGRTCTTCHGAELRPLWQGYSYWPDSFVPVSKASDLLAPEADGDATRVIESAVAARKADAETFWETHFAPRRDLFGCLDVANAANKEEFVLKLHHNQTAFSTLLAFWNHARMLRTFQRRFEAAGKGQAEYAAFIARIVRETDDPPYPEGSVKLKTYRSTFQTTRALDASEWPAYRMEVGDAYGRKVFGRLLDEKMRKAFLPKEGEREAIVQLVSHVTALLAAEEVDADTSSWSMTPRYEPLAPGASNQKLSKQSYLFRGFFSGRENTALFLALACDEYLRLGGKADDPSLGFSSCANGSGEKTLDDGPLREIYQRARAVSLP